jgi:hypothetical protein
VSARPGPPPLRARLIISRPVYHEAGGTIEKAPPRCISNRELSRLVVRELERRWEAALKDLQQVEQEYARFRQKHPHSLTCDEREAIRSLSKNLPALWHASTTTASDRQRIVCLLLERVVVNVQGSTDHADVALQWAGGFTSQHELIRPVLRYDQMADYKRMVDRIEELRGQGWSLAKIGTDQRLGVSFDQQDGSAVGGWTEYGVIGAYAHTARHAVKCAEWCRTQDVAWRSSPRTGRAGFRLR